MLIAGNMVLPWLLPLLLVILVAARAVHDRGRADPRVGATSSSTTSTTCGASSPSCCSTRRRSSTTRRRSSSTRSKQIANYGPTGSFIIAVHNMMYDLRMPGHRAARPAGRAARSARSRRRMGLQPAVATLRGGDVSAAGPRARGRPRHEDVPPPPREDELDQAAHRRQGPQPLRRRSPRSKDVTFDVREGEVFGVIGQNGSGKSTLLKCMAGILQPNSGSVTRAQADVGAARARRRLPPRADRPRERVPQRSDPRHGPTRHRRRASTTSSSSPGSAASSTRR